MERGYIQVYTGDGKGKTTAAIGLAIRAAGAGLKVYFAQLLKKWPYSELKGLERYADAINIEQFGTGEHITGNPRPEDVAAARRGLAAVRAAIDSGRYDLVVMDEAGTAELLKVIETADILEIMNSKPQGVELVVTGRGVSKAVIQAADLVTEMKMIRHYCQPPVCVLSRKGIDC